jgi:N-acetylglucosamine kinase-like BadF-type ATPase
MNPLREKFFLGVDGGNSKTIALIASADGRVIGAGRGGCADIYAPPSSHAALDAVHSAVSAALDTAKISPADLAAAVFSMAGADWPEDFQFLHDAFVARRYASQILVVNDAIGAILAGSPEGWGAAIVCGTGGTAGARSPQGKTWHGGFWHDNSCGGSSLGDAALAAVLRSQLQIAPPTALTRLVLQHYQQSSVENLLHSITRRADRLPRQSAALARLVLDTAAAGDPVARQIVEIQAQSAAQYVLVAIRQVGLPSQPFHLVLAGGIFRHPSDLLASILIHHVQQRTPHAIPIHCQIEPVAGALLAAFQLDGQTITPELRRRLEDTHPPAALFETR